MENEYLENTNTIHNSFNHLSHSLTYLDNKLKDNGIFIQNDSIKNSKQKNPKINKCIQNLLNNLCQRKKMNFFTFDLLKNGNSLILWNKDSMNYSQENDIFTFPKVIKKPIKKNIQNVIKNNILFNNKIKTIKERIKKLPRIAQVGRYSPNYSCIFKHIPTIHLNLKKRDESDNINKYKKIDLKICNKYKKLYYEQFRNSNSFNNSIKNRNIWKKKYHKDIENNFYEKEKKNKSQNLKSKSIYIKKK